MILAGPVATTQAAPVWLDAVAEYSLFSFDFNGDGVKDVAEVLGDRLNLFMTSPDNLETAQKPEATIAIPRDIAVLGAVKLTTGSTQADWIGLGRNGLWRLDKPASDGSFQKVTSMTLILPESFHAPHLSDLTEDLNNDGIDEILTPGQDSLDIWSMSPSGELTKRVSIPWEKEMRQAFDSRKVGSVLSASYADQPFVWLAQRPAARNGEPWSFNAIRQVGERTPAFYFSDINNDSFLDLTQEHGGVMLQKEDFQFEAPDSQLATYSGLDGFTFLADFNADGVKDGLLIRGSRDLANTKTLVEFYRGRQNEPYAISPDAKLLTADYTFSPEKTAIVDFNNDGYLDIMLTKVDLNPAGVQSNVEAFFRGGLNLYLRVFLWDPKGGDDKKGFFAPDPAFIHYIKLTYEIFGLLSDQDAPIIAEYDMTGDKLPDLITKVSDSEVGLFPQRPGGKGFEAYPSKTVRLNHQAQALYARDVDGQPPVETLCLSAPDREGNRQAGIARW